MAGTRTVALLRLAAVGPREVVQFVNEQRISVLISVMYRNEVDW